jgi:hypothetical protein
MLQQQLGISMIQQTTGGQLVVCHQVLTSLQQIHLIEIMKTQDGCSSILHHGLKGLQMGL